MERPPDYIHGFLVHEGMDYSLPILPAGVPFHSPLECFLFVVQDEIDLPKRNPEFVGHKHPR